MQKKIQKLAKGKFDYARPELKFTPEKIAIEALEGKDFTGEFVITSANRVPMRGIVFSSDPRMECLTSQFEGEEVKIRYQYHTNGCVEGEHREGEFSLICNQGEYSLPFVVSICKLHEDSSIGKIKDLDDFTALAKENFSEASQLFFKDKFSSIIEPEQVRERLLYEGLRHGGIRGQKVEEFLTAIHKKEPVDISIEKTEASFYNIRESIRETLEIHKTQWGYVDIKVTSDADFLVPWKIHLTGEDFFGSVCRFDYYIRAEALHGGNNFGRICFEIPGRKLEFTVCASKASEKLKLQTDLYGNVQMLGNAMMMEELHTFPDKHRQEEEGKVRLLQLYMDYRLKKIVTGVWSAGTIEILNQFMEMNPENPWYSLMKAQALIINRQRQEADWILRDFKRAWNNRTSPVWGYYLYLCTLMEREPSYVDRISLEIEEIFRRHPDNSVLFWILLYVKEEYCKDGAKRLRAIQQWIARGNCSPYFYLEAYYQIWQEPYLLGRLDGFTIQVLNWARKQRAITKDVALVVMSALKDKKEFNPLVYRILEECYRVNPRDELLMAICGYLIKGQRFDTEYHHWYELGIEREIRITSLYEAFLLSLDEQQVDSVPRMIQLYFHYNSSIPYQRKAILFANIIAGKNTQPEVYQKYRRSIEQFAMEQIEAGHINDDLAMVYDEMLMYGILDGELAQHLSKILFTHKLVCDDASVTRAIVWQKELAQPQVVSITNGVAYFQAYTNDYCIILENGRGNCFTDSITWHEQPLLYPEAYLEKCLELAPNEVPYVLYHFHKKQSWQDFSENDANYFELLLQSSVVKESYKATLLPEILRYYQKQGNQDAIEKYLEYLDPDTLQNEEQKFVTELLTGAFMYEKAYRAVQVFGYDELELSYRVSLCNYAIHACEFEEDEFLLRFVADTFLQDKYDDVMLLYLCKYYHGTTDHMMRMWLAAGEFQMDTAAMEERILTQMLYTGQFIDGIDDVYDSYVAGGGSDSYSISGEGYTRTGGRIGSAILCMAYLSAFADRYFREEMQVPSHVFVQLQELYFRGEPLSDTCKLALLKYLANRKQLSNRQYEAVDELLTEFTDEKIYFGFYRLFDERFLRKFLLKDRFFVEYHTVPGRRVYLHYDSPEIRSQSEEMTEMYDGVYVKSFLLFHGETVPYYITEENGAITETVKRDVLCYEATETSDGKDRYGCLNRMLEVVKHEENETEQSGETMIHMESLAVNIKDYYETQTKVEKLFTIL